MGYVPENEMTLKIKALREAFEELKKISTPAKHYLKYQEITDVANTTEWGEALPEPMLIEVIKQSTNKDIQALRKDIIEYKSLLKMGKKIVGSNINNKIADLKEKVKSLTSVTATLFDELEERDGEIKTLNTSLDKVKKERDGYIQTLKENGL